MTNATRAARGLPTLVFTAMVVLSCSSSPAGMGAQRQACFANGTCDKGLICLSDICVVPPDGGAGTTGSAGSAGGSGASGGAGAAGGAAGTSGVDAAAGTTGAAGADAAAGSSGDAAAGTTGAAGADAAAGSSGDAAAGAAGHDAAAGASGTAGTDGGAAGASNCVVKTSYTTLSFGATAQGADEYDFPLMTGQTEATDEVVWEGVLDTSATPSDLELTFVSGFEPFLHQIEPTSAIDLSLEGDYQSCGACVLLEVQYAADGVTPLAAPEMFLAFSGSMNLVGVPSFPAVAGDRISGSISNAVFNHVSIDPTTYVTTVVDACQITLTSATFDAPVVNMPVPTN